MEHYRVILSKSARKELRNAADYIATQLLAPISAYRKIRRIREIINNRLSFMPQKYRTVNDSRIASMGYHMMNVENYIVFFSIDESKNIVWVERIIHSKRDWKHVLLE